MWVKNTNGKKDAMLTFALVSFFVITLNIFLATFGSVQIGDVTLTFTPLDSSVMAVYLGATFTAYVSRRWTDKRFIESIQVGQGGMNRPTPVPIPEPTPPPHIPMTPDLRAEEAPESSFVPGGGGDSPPLA